MMMTRSTKYIPLLLTIGATAAVVLLTGCQSDRNPTSLPGAHPDHWMDYLSPDFHGAFVLVDGTESCAHCHGIEEAGGKVGIACVDCHGPSGSACNGCHGGLDNTTGAPPYGLDGELSVTALAVGAHTAHLDTSALAGPVACSSCHIVPAFLSAPDHLDLLRGSGLPLDSIAEIVWHGLAATGSSVWDRNARTCSGSYCHGSFAGGDNTNTPVWTGTDQAACGSCHDIGSDPAQLGWKHAYHVGTASLACGECHAAMIDTLDNIIDPMLHVNGVANMLVRDSSVCEQCHGGGTAGCTGCHGGTDNQTGAPPVGLHGETTPDQLAVGAHTVHLDGGILADAFACDACHTVPTDFSSPGHLGADSIAELTWGALAGPSSTWDRAAATCSDTYCHGNFNAGDPTNAPVWTGTDQAACGSCHDVGLNPATLGWKHEGHVFAAGLSCGECHSSMIDTLDNITDPSLHVNGQVDTLIRDQAVCDECHGASEEACTLCHGGTDNLTGAPPVGLRGETSTNQLAVGAHTIHLEGGTFADGFACETCHIVPTSLLSAGHYAPDSVAEMTWGPLAGSSSAWDRTTASCNDTYCHGNFRGGNDTNVPRWTSSNQAACGSCHDVGTDPGSLRDRHFKHVSEENLECYECHFTVVDGSNNIIGPGLHVNGANSVSIRLGGTYSGGSCSGLFGASCHGREDW